MRLTPDELGNAFACCSITLNEAARRCAGTDDNSVPSGMQRRITYAVDASPVLAVKLQELFGLADTPRIADVARAS